MFTRQQSKKQKENIVKIKSEKQQKKFICCECNNETAFSADIDGTHINHCPRCLSLRHFNKKFLDDAATDCGGCMRAIGLAFKKEGTDKHNNQKEEELMIIHECVVCDKISVNRLASDDDETAIISLFHKSLLLESKTKQKLLSEKIVVVCLQDKEKVFIKLFEKSINKIRH